MEYEPVPETDRRQESRQSINDMLDTGAMLNVAPLTDGEGVLQGFRLTLKEKSESGGLKRKIVLVTYLADGGLCDERGIRIFEAYEFSMHRYANRSGTRAPTEYVRRKLAAGV